MSNPLEDLETQVWVLGALGRLARQGLLEAPAPADDPLAVAAQRLLVRAGLLDIDPVRPSASLSASLPPWLPSRSLSSFATATLALVSAFARGDAGGWREEDPEVIRFYGEISGRVVTRLLAEAISGLPGFPDRLDEPGAAFLDVGAGACGICIELCRQHPKLSAVGLEINPPSLAIGRKTVATAGLADRIEVRDQSVTEIDDEAAYDLLWVPQPFLPTPVLTAALPRLHRAARPGAVVVMGLAEPSGDGNLTAAAAEVGNLMAGGGQMPAELAAGLLARAGFVDIRPVGQQGHTVLVARRADD